MAVTFGNRKAVVTLNTFVHAMIMLLFNQGLKHREISCVLGSQGHQIS